MTNPTPTDWRALCAELVDDLELWVAFGEVEPTEESHALIDRARAALAQAEPQGPTHGLLGWCLFDPDGRLRPEALEVLAACRLMPPTPVPVAERLPGPEDCDGEGRCWWWDKDELSWTKGSPKYCAGSYGPWLPHHALPVPQNNA
jgi:hypothetical protein